MSETFAQDRLLNRLHILAVLLVTLLIPRKDSKLKLSVNQQTSLSRSQLRIHQLNNPSNNSSAKLLQLPSNSLSMSLVNNNTALSSKPDPTMPNTSSSSPTFLPPNSHSPPNITPSDVRSSPYQPIRLYP